MNYILNQAEILKLVRSYLPNSSDYSIEQLTVDIIKDVEPIIFSYVRQITSQEKEKIYLQKSKNPV